MKRSYDEPKEYLIDFGKRVRSQRKHLGLSQEQAAEKVGVSTNFYGKVERGIHGLSYDSLKRIQKAFNISLDYLLTGEILEQADSPIIKILREAPEDKRIYLEEILIAASKLYKEEN